MTAISSSPSADVLQDLMLQEYNSMRDEALKEQTPEGLNKFKALLETLKTHKKSLEDLRAFMECMSDNETERQGHILSKPELTLLPNDNESDKKIKRTTKKYLIDGFKNQSDMNQKTLETINYKIEEVEESIKDTKDIINNFEKP